MKKALPIAAACLMLVVSGCVAKRLPTGEDYYAQAQEEYSGHFYKPAIDNYQKMIDEYPFSPYSEEAELKIGLAYYKMHNFAEAAGSLSDFLQMHPTSKQLDIASYYLAMSNYAQVGRVDQDQTHTEQALAQFQQIEQEFPESDFAQLSHEDAEICREILARHDYIIGDFYYKRANLKASESRMAEVMSKYPDTPVAPDALYMLAVTLEKQGKKYSAAQAFTAVKLHFPKSKYAQMADSEIKQLNQPVDTEEDPLKLVLAESGFNADDSDQGNVSVREDLASLGGGAGAQSGGAYGSNDLPILDRPDIDKNSAEAKAPTGPSTLRTIRLSSTDPPLSVIFDLTAPVEYDQRLDKGSDSSTLTVLLKNTTPDPKLDQHLVFDRSIFKDCSVESGADGTKVTVNTSPVDRFAIIPLDKPPRLLVTFTPEGGVAQAGAAPAEPTDAGPLGGGGGGGDDSGAPPM